MAIILRKRGDYQGEVAICEQHIDAFAAFYHGGDLHSYADVRRGQRYEAIVHRLGKARQLAARAAMQG